MFSSLTSSAFWVELQKKRFNAMRVFLSAFTGFLLAIPMHCVSSLMLCDRKTEHTADYDNENRNTYISLPKMLGLPMENTRHGIILKDGNNEKEDSNTVKNKTILLTAEIECETEIPGEKIYPLPKVFNSFRFSALFSGIQFDSGNPVLLLDIEQLLQRIH